MKKIFLPLFILSIITVGCFGNNDEEKILTNQKPTRRRSVSKTESPIIDVFNPEAQDGVGNTGLTQRYTIQARMFEFSPSTIRVKAGNTVKLKIIGVDVEHGFALDEFGIKEKILPGETTEIEFVADKKGIFEYYCHIPCGKGHKDMKGRLIVE